MSSSNVTAPAASPDRPTLLIVDDDVTSLNLLERGLTTLFGYDVKTAASARDGHALVLRERFDLLLVDLRLPDMSGIDLVQLLADERGPVPFVLVTGFADVPTTVEAMRLGAFTVLEKPVSLDDLAEVAERVLSRARGGSCRQLQPLHQPSADRLASHIVNACSSDRDFKTLGDWARFEGLSYSSLCETCRLAGVRPHDARDFARILRCVVRGQVGRCSPDVLLDVSDHRTLEALLRKGGFGERISRRISVEQYLDLQQFIPAGNPVLEIILRYVVTRN